MAPVASTDGVPIQAKSQVKSQDPHARISQFVAIGLFFAACGSLWNYLGALFHPNALAYSHAFFLEDILPTYNAARAILAGHGASMYDPAIVHGYTYTPFFAWLFTPLALLPWDAAGSIWYILCHVWLWLAVAALTVVFHDVLPATLLDLRVGRVALVPLLLAIWLGIPPSVQATLDFGQVDYLSLALLATALVCLRRQRDTTAGVLVVLAGLLKLTPFGLILAFVVFRRWRALGGALAMLGASILVTSLDPRVGFATWLHLQDGANANFAFIFGQYANESVGSVFAHLIALAHHHLSARRAEYIGLAISGILYLGVLALGRWPAALRSPRWLVGVAASIGTVLLASPLNWDHTYVVAAVPTAFLLGAIATQYLAERRLRWQQIVGVVAASIMASWPMTAALSVPQQEPFHLQLYGTLLISARPIALLTITALLLWYLWYPGVAAQGRRHEEQPAR